MMSKLNVSAYVALRIKRSKNDFIVNHYTSNVKAGGGGKDTSNTAVRIRDKITGVFAECQEERSQKENRKRAFNRLVERLIKYYQKEELNSVVSKMKQNNAHIRTYAEKGNAVYDERIPNKQFKLNKVLNGDLIPIVKELINGQ